MSQHTHVFLGEGHDENASRTWTVIWLCGAMMLLEIIGGIWFGSIALVADGMHMSTHAGALLLAALAYKYARKHADDRRFSFGTGKMGDLAGFTSAIILAMISLLIGYEAISRIFAPVPIHFAEAIPIAFLGLGVNVVSAWLLSGGGHHHHGHGHDHGHDHAHHHDHNDFQTITTTSGTLALEIFEDGVPPRLRLTARTGALPAAASIETIRPDGGRQVFAMQAKADYLESVKEIPEPHAFVAEVMVDGAAHQALFEEHEHATAKTGRDNNMRAAVVHVMADAAVSVLVIMGLILAKLFGWLWMDPLAGIIGALVIASWALGLVRDTGAILLDMTPDADMEAKIRQTIESKEDGEGDTLTDLHLWRLGPGHLGAIISIITPHPHGPDHYRAKLSRFKALSHLTVEVRQS
ncbi:MAG: CDF family Co(II)/Ni(II) efflux transporter DmeF [Acidocella sp.]|nr:CDF family Co(II)/Ni(II) efflux transporter DmeF [Acidocella sp.]